MWKLPEITDWAKTQNKHEPTRSYGEEIFRVVRELVANHRAFFYTEPNNKFRALEVGSAWGVSTMAILMAGADSLRSVDSDPTVKAINEVAANNLNDKWEFLNMKSTDYWKMVSDKFDFIYVDGSHLYGNAKEDIFAAWKLLKPGCVLMMDDFTHPKNIVGDPTRENEAEYGVSLAAWELFKEKHLAGEIEDVSCTTRLLMFRKKA